MNRRGFLKGLGAAAVAVLTPAAIAANSRTTMSWYEKKSELTGWQQHIISFDTQGYQVGDRIIVSSGRCVGKTNGIYRIKAVNSGALDVEQIDEKDVYCEGSGSISRRVSRPGFSYQGTKTGRISGKQPYYVNIPRLRNRDRRELSSTRRSLRDRQAANTRDGHRYTIVQVRS